MAIRAAIIGVTGRMGRALIRAAAESQVVRVCAGVASASSSALGQDIGELAGLERCDVPVTSDLRAALTACDVAIDFSNGDATAANVAACRELRKALLVGTTGFGAQLEPQLQAAATAIPLLIAPNTSLGVTLLIELVSACARSLPESFDIEIVEAHHRMKRDAPSGTALALGRAAAEARGRKLDDTTVTNRAGSVAPRREGDIGFAVVRGGDLVGEHTVLFAGAGEQLSLTHKATDRAIFARGALAAAVWLAGQPPGRYLMRDFIGMKSKS